MSDIIYLIKFAPDDFDRYYELVGNAKVMAMITERAIPVHEALEDYDLILQNNRLHQSFGNFKVILKPNNQFIGLAKLEIKEDNAKEAELGYMLLPEYWGRGLGNEIARLLLAKAKEIGFLKKVMAIIDPNNIPSRKILINNGFVSEKVCLIDGLPGEILSFKLIQTDNDQRT